MPGATQLSYPLGLLDFHRLALDNTGGSLLFLANATSDGDRISLSYIPIPQ
jgi:hypothetical protein